MKQMHTADYYLALLQPLGISTAANDPMLELPPATEQRASSIIADQIHHQPFAIFHPGSARVEKFWEPERWAEVIEIGRASCRERVRSARLGHALHRSGGEPL